MANDADDQRPTAAEDDTHANASVSSSDSDQAADEDVTILATAPTLEADEFPQGLSSRELALTLKGQLLGHFHLQEFIGGGGMGAVFRALDTTLDRIVAVKVVASQSISTEDLQRRFLVEAQSTARLDHANIARIHYVGRDRGLPYIVFEYIEGINLRDLVVNHGTIPLGDALSFTYQIAHALAHAWQKDVVHRDIKPSNILITPAGQAKLVDMGLARLHQVDAADDDLTNTGVTLGTFDYISPEQARDPRDADIRSDIYSLGCTLFYMLAGRPPFADGTAVQKLLQHQDQQPPDLADLRPGLPESVPRLVQSMLAKSPEARPQTPSELVEICNGIFSELGIQPPAALAPLPIAQHTNRAEAWTAHLPWIVPIAGLALAVALWGNFGTDASQHVEFAPLRFPAAESQPAESNEPPTTATALPTEDTASVLPPADESLEASIEVDLQGVALGWEDYAPPTMQSSGSSLLDLQPANPILPADSSAPPDDDLNVDEIFRF